MANGGTAPLARDDLTIRVHDDPTRTYRRHRRHQRPLRVGHAGRFAPHDIQSLPCADYPRRRRGSARLPEPRRRHRRLAPREACLAFACPVHGERVVMTNNHWDFTKTAVREALNLDLFKVINDFMAQALGVPHVDDDELVTLQEGTTRHTPHGWLSAPAPGSAWPGSSPAAKLDPAAYRRRSRDLRPHRRA